MKKIKILISLILVSILSIPLILVKASTINTTNITLYALPEGYDKLTIPSNILTQYQLQISGSTEKPTYTVTTDNDSFDGPSIEVSESGLITPRYRNYYCKYYDGYRSCGYSQPDSSYELTTRKLITGTSYVTVKVGTETFKVTVKVESYAVYYAEKTMEDYVKNNITSDMTEKEKMEKILDLISQTDYSPNSSSYVGLFSGDGADCIGDSSAILYMCDLVGIKAHMRYAAQDPGAGSGHRNVAALLDGQVYIADANSTSAPRSTWLDPTHNGFSAFGSLLQYDGYDEDVVIPNGFSSINEKALLYGNHSETVIKTLTVPNTLTKIGPGAFNGAPTLTTINMAEDNPNYITINNLVYTKDKTHLVTSASGIKSKKITIDPKTTEIESYALSYNDNVEEIVLPEGLQKIDLAAFYDNDNLKSLTVPKSVTSIDSGAVYIYGDNFKYWLIKNPNVSLGKDLCGYNIAMYGQKGSTAEEYANAHGCPFVEVTQENLIPLDTLDIDFPTEIQYQGSENIPSFTIKDGNYILKENVDYTVKYTNNTMITEEAKVRIIGIGKYIGLIDKKFAITERNIAEAEIEGLSDTYAASNPFNVNPGFDIKLTWHGTPLNLYIDYDVFHNNSSFGKATLTIRGNSYYHNNLIKEYNIISTSNLIISLPQKITMQTNQKMLLPAKYNDKVINLAYTYPSFKSSNTNAVEIDSKGNLTAKQKGSSTITFYLSGKTYTTTVEVTDYKKGDINKDNIIDVLDAREALSFAVGRHEVTDQIILTGDMDLDNKITATDAAQILKVYLKK